MRLPALIDQIVCGDSLEVMDKMPPNSIDLIVTSPPYNVGKEYANYDDKRDVLEYHSWLQRVCQRCFRLIKPNSNIFINIADVGVSNRDATGIHRVGERGNFYVIPNHLVVIEEMLELGAQYLHPILWQKPSNHKSQFGASARFCGTYPFPKNCHVPSEVEYILHFRKNGLYEKVDKERKEKSRVSKERWMQLSSQVWQFHGTNDRRHPAQFPVELPSRCIEGWSFVGDVVLDPFMGVGNTAIACKKLGRRFIGVDLSEDYCIMARKSVAEMVGPSSIERTVALGT